MSKTMLKDLHKDIERYLQEDCYCPNEVYSVDGFYFMYVYADNEAELLGEYVYKGDDVLLIATTANKEKKPILLTVWVNKEDKVSSMERYDLTEHNINEVKAVLKGEKESVTLSEHDELIKQTQKILSLADAVCVDIGKG